MDPLNRVCNCIAATYRGLQGRQHKRTSVFAQNLPKIANFLPKTVLFLVFIMHFVIDDRRGRGRAH